MIDSVFGSFWYILDGFWCSDWIYWWLSFYWRFFLFWNNHLFLSNRFYERFFFVSVWWIPADCRFLTAPETLANHLVLSISYLFYVGPYYSPNIKESHSLYFKYSPPLSLSYIIQNLEKAEWFSSEFGHSFFAILSLGHWLGNVSTYDLGHSGHIFYTSDIFCSPLFCGHRYNI